MIQIITLLIASFAPLSILGKSLTSINAGLLAIMLAIYYYQNRTIFKWEYNGALILILLGLFMAIPGFITTPNWLMSGSILLRTMALLGLGVVVAAFLRAHNHVYTKLWRWFFIISIVVLFYWHFISTLQLVEFWGNSNKMRNMLAGAIIMLAVAGFSYNRKMAIFTVFLAGLTFYPPLKILGLYNGGLASRSAEIALVLAFGFMGGLLFLKKYKPVFMLAFAKAFFGALLAFAVFLIYVSPKPEYDNPEFTNKSIEMMKQWAGIAPLEVVNRTQSWGYGWEIAKQNPVFGVGINQLRLQPGADVVIPGLNIAAQNDLKFTFNLTFSHFSWLELLTETGLLATILLYIGLHYGIIRHIRQYQMNGGLWHRPLITTGMGVYGIYALFSSFSVWSFHYLSVYIIAFIIIQSEE